ncbi:hypothetical protein ANCCAN_03131 [Ancylostoma caninum]|uniref:Uncharacterized protein n=1 Tax=Ancylostoma caninum TaxID=29170 RepID=A0A368H648_ANCCA|nr:hypothetical protein ANCCAN_03131 [Ancylostoma caninum]
MIDPFWKLPRLMKPSKALLIARIVFGNRFASSTSPHHRLTNGRLQTKRGGRLSSSLRSTSEYVRCTRTLSTFAATVRRCSGRRWVTRVCGRDRHLSASLRSSSSTCSSTSNRRCMDLYRFVSTSIFNYVQKYRTSFQSLSSVALQLCFFFSERVVLVPMAVLFFLHCTNIHMYFHIFQSVQSYYLLVLCQLCCASDSSCCINTSPFKNEQLLMFMFHRTRMCCGTSVVVLETTARSRDVL